MFKGRGSLSDDVGVPSNVNNTSEYTALKKSLVALKKGAKGDDEYQALVKKDTGYVIPAPEEPQYETPGQNVTYEEPKISPQISETTYQVSETTKPRLRLCYTSSWDKRGLRRHQNGKKLSGLRGAGSKQEGSRRKPALCLPNVGKNLNWLLVAHKDCI